MRPEKGQGESEAEGSFVGFRFLLKPPLLDGRWETNKESSATILQKNPIFFSSFAGQLRRRNRVQASWPRRQAQSPWLPFLLAELLCVFFFQPICIFLDSDPYRLIFHLLLLGWKGEKIQRN
ncbi:hypothetical protein KFK09_001203 [Dendrobium nobile]|uniref:Uncharacterized protein n=1 Tax=Dendrobium nobile TaxID=94219 RepID=A0A8T3C9P3_DENNO|nr:hypothetical protein KFK09_001203 [Dendrobium nobile]